MIHTDGVARELIKLGHEVYVIIQDSRDAPQLFDPPYNIVRLPGGTYSFLGQIAFIFYLFFHFRLNNYDVIHDKNPFSSVLPAFFSRTRSKVIYDVRGLWIDFGIHSGYIPSFLSSFLWAVDLWCLKKADKVIAISFELKNELMKRGLNEEHIKVIVGAGVAFEEIQILEPMDIRENLGINGKLVGYVGGIDRSRNSENIVKAFKYVHEDIDSAKLILIGPVVEKDFFLDLVENLSLSKNVYFTDFLPHKDALCFMKSFDVAISYHEGDFPFFNVAVPNKILEYLSTGCCIVTTDHKMYKNLLKHDFNGYLTKQNVKDFARGIITVLNDESIANKLKSNTISSVKKYSFRNISIDIINIYEEMFNKNE